MPTLSKMDAAEKEQYCQNIYERYILETSEFLVSCDEIADVLRTYIPSGCYTNFRDALFHFRSMVNASEVSIIFSQVASIIEHANRAMRDAEVALCVRCVTIFDVLKSRVHLEDNVLMEINQQIAALQNCILRLRLGNMMLEGMDFWTVSNEDFFDIIESYFICAETHVKDEFKEVIAYSKELKEKFMIILKNAFESENKDDFQNFRAFSTYNDVAELICEAVFDD
nr:hypothetical protein [uncultured Acetatifactor sp.]